MRQLVAEIQHNKLLWLLIFVPVVFGAERVAHDSPTLLFALSGTLMISKTLRIPKL